VVVVGPQVRDHPTGGGQGVQCGHLRFTRVRGVPGAGEALGFGELGGGISVSRTDNKRLTELPVKSNMDEHKQHCG
jgi:hypothetical protein